MKRILVVTFALLTMASCFDDSAIWEELKNHEERIIKLETLCNQMNTNIASLQTVISALQKNDFITNISPITENGKEIGYTITFSKTGTVTIYHGSDGKDGAEGNNGKDGSTPIISVRQDEDGVYYWTLNGEWLRDDDGNKIPTTGKDGADGKDGVDGSDGKDGADGKDGVDGSDGKDGADGKDGVDGSDGVTPKLKIEDGYWYVSYNNGDSWECLGKAVAEYDSCIVKDIRQDEQYVHITLSDGSIISIPLRKGLLISFEMPEIQDIAGYKYTIPYVISGSFGKSEIGTICQDGWDASVNQFDDCTGEIVLTSPVNYRDGKVHVYVNNNGCSILKTLELITPAIEFEDNVVGDAYITYFDQNYDGKLSFREAAEVTDDMLASSYRPFPAEGRYFKEFKYFTSITRLPYSYFADTNITEVVLPEGITDIANAFHGCKSLLKLEIPEGVTELNGTFSGCVSLQSVNFPSTLKNVDAKAFSECSALKSISITSLEDWMGIVFTNYNNHSSFYDLWSYSNVDEVVELKDNEGSRIENIILPEGVKEIKSGTFGGLAIKTVQLPSTLISIGEFAFGDCYVLEEINIPSCVESIGAYAFVNCSSINKVHVSSFDEWISISFENIYSNPLVSSTHSVLIDKNGNQINSFQIPEGTTVIKSGVFAGFDDLEYISIPSSITTIEAYAFAGCSNLKSVVIPENVVSIGVGAFYNCKSLEDVIINEGLGGIADETFGSCVSLKKIVIPESVVSIGVRAFYNCRSLEDVIINEGLGGIADETFGSCVSLKKIVIPESVVSIGVGAFYNCSSLEDIIIPKSVTVIGSSAFYGCQSVKNVYVNDFGYWLSIDFGDEYSSPLTSSASVGMNPNLIDKDGNVITDFQIPQWMEVIECGPYCGLHALVELDLPSGVTFIDRKAFASCLNLRKVSIPSSVTSFESAFVECASLQTIELKDGIQAVSRSAFRGCTSLVSISIPQSVKVIESSAFEDCTSLHEINMSEGLERVRFSAFSGCESLKKIVFPSSITRLECIEPYMCELFIKALTPPRISFSYYNNGDIAINPDLTIYVPRQSVQQYKKDKGDGWGTTDCWATCADMIVGYDF